MNVFPLLEDSELADETKLIFDEIKQLLGSVPVFYRFLANVPALTEAYWVTYKNVILTGSLGPSVKELIFLAVAIQRRCVYCSSVHLAICDLLEIDRSNLHNILTDVSSMVPKSTAMLIEFCISTLDNPDATTKEQYQGLEDAGLSKDEIIEALYTVAYAESGIFMAKAIKLNVDQSVSDYLQQKHLSIGFS